MTKTDEDLAPDAGGNSAQFDDGRDPETGRLPEPLDAAYYGDPNGPAMNLPGMPLSQPAGTGPVVSSPVPDAPADEAAAADGEATADAGSAIVTTAGDEQANEPAKPAGLATMPRAQG